jgi:transcriptional regulator GlxA family with amidase domain
MAVPAAPRRIGIVIYANAQNLDVTGPHEVFAMANLVRQLAAAPPAYEVFLVAESLDPVPMTSGLRLQPDHDFASCPFPLDTLVVPGSALIDSVRDNPAMLRWLRRHAGDARRLVSVCTGAFFLAELGLLDGKKVATHWMFCKQLQDGYRQLEVVPNSLYIKEGNVYTSAGITAGMDLALTLVEEDCGKEVAMMAARTLVLFYRRPGGQNQFSELLVSQSSEHFGELIEWVMQNLRQDLTVERLAGRVSMSPRNFSRLFTKELGQSPAKFVEILRLRHARTLLEGGRMALKEIAGKAGFKSAEQMRRAFQRELRVTPQEYRARF